MYSLRSLLCLAGLLTAVLSAPTIAAAATPGVNLAGEPTPDVVNRVAQTGAKTVRVFLSWKYFEGSSPNEFPPSEPPAQAQLKRYDDGLRQLNAIGVRPIYVIMQSPPWANGGSQNGMVPPLNAQDYANFVGKWAAHSASVGSVAGYEIWNEPDESTFWQPGPDVGRYTEMLRASYQAIKAADPSATVVAGATVGNNLNWYREIYRLGGGGSFDVAAVHTDTSCLVDPPDKFYREADGTIGRYTFLGYREIHDLMVANGDGNKQIWMTELGWSSTNGGSKSCTDGINAGKKADGVTTAAQAEHLTSAYRCLANYPYIGQALWFTLTDTTENSVRQLNHYGLYTTAGRAKPALAAFQRVARAGGGAAGPCGDFTGPKLNVMTPRPNEQFVSTLDITSKASDGGVGMARVSYTYDGGKPIRNFVASSAAIDFKKQLRLAPWYGARNLGLGPHTIEVTASDANGNITRRLIPVVKVNSMRATLTPKVTLKSKKVSCTKGRICRISGQVKRSTAGSPTLSGKVAVEWQFRNKQGKWRKLVGGLKPANKPFTFTTKRLKFAGRWRVRVRYASVAPWRSANSKFLYFSVK